MSDESIWLRLSGALSSRRPGGSLETKGAVSRYHTARRPNAAACHKSMSFAGLRSLVLAFLPAQTLQGFDRAEFFEQARVVDGGVVSARHCLRVVEPRHPVTLEIVRMNV